MEAPELGVFAHKPAPIQMTWLGYPNTTGLPTVDYRITDDLADPPGMTESLHTERLIRLPGGFIAFQPPHLAPPVAPAPCLRNGHVTFGCFNNFAKVTPRTLCLWARVLTALPDSRLIIKTRAMGDPPTCRRTLDFLAGRGVLPARVDLCPFVGSYREHLAAYGRLDIALDCFPYHGTATTCEALWMGVPVVSLAGRAHVSRVGVSLLSRIGLDGLAAPTDDAFIAAALALAADPQSLGRLRLSMRDRLQQPVDKWASSRGRGFCRVPRNENAGKSKGVLSSFCDAGAQAKGPHAAEAAFSTGCQASPLLDVPGLARHLEQAYREAWSDWLAGG